MNNIEILEEYLDKQDRKFVTERRLMILETIENLIQENKKLIMFKSKIINLLENEVLDISGFECIAKEDLQELLEEDNNMSKTIKIIDLLNKIARGEGVPENIKYYNRNLKETDIMLCCKENIIDKLNRESIYLNDEVEIIEEQGEINVRSNDK